MVTAPLGLMWTLTVTSSILTSTHNTEAVANAVFNSMNTQPKYKTVLRYMCLVISNICYISGDISFVDAADHNEGEEYIKAIVTDVAMDEARSYVTCIGGIEVVLEILHNQNTNLDMQ